MRKSSNGLLVLSTKFTVFPSISIMSGAEVAIGLAAPRTFAQTILHAVQPQHRLARGAGVRIVQFKIAVEHTHYLFTEGYRFHASGNDHVVL